MTEPSESPHKPWYSSIGNTIHIEVQLSHLEPRYRRDLLRTLLLDIETCPGRSSLGHDEYREVLKAIDMWCGWS